VATCYYDARAPAQAFDDASAFFTSAFGVSSVSHEPVIASEHADAFVFVQFARCLHVDSNRDITTEIAEDLSSLADFGQALLSMQSDCVEATLAELAARVESFRSICDQLFSSLFTLGSVSFNEILDAPSPVTSQPPLPQRRCAKSIASVADAAAVYPTLSSPLAAMSTLKRPRKQTTRKSLASNVSTVVRDSLSVPPIRSLDSMALTADVAMQSAALLSPLASIPILKRPRGHQAPLLSALPVRTSIVPETIVQT
jgi:hypothetical protein